MKATDIPAPLPWEQRSNSISPMPGPVTGFLDMLMKTCIKVNESQQLSSNELADWMRDGSQRNSQFTSDCVKFLLKAGLIEQEDNGILHLPELMYRWKVGSGDASRFLKFLLRAGLIEQEDSVILQLPEQIYRWMETKDDNILISVVHSKVRFIGEMLAELDEPKSAQELHDLAAKKYGFNWNANPQEVDNRRNWLMSAKLVERLSDNRMVISDAGRALRNLLEIYEPDEGIFDYDELQRKTSELLGKIKESPGSHRPVGIDKPEKMEQTVVRYARIPRVQAYVLNRAGNACELCSNQAPFVKEDGIPFLEIHHIVQLSQGGPDTPENTVALCPNCHRHLHYGKDRKKKEQELQKNIKEHQL